MEGDSDTLMSVILATLFGNDFFRLWIKGLNKLMLCVVLA